MKTKFIEEIQLIAKSDLFDGAWYVEQYPDVPLSKMDPAEHYLRIGAQLGRNPSPMFDANDYSSRNPDIYEARIPALLHYEQHGRSEGRQYNPIEHSLPSPSLLHPVDASETSNWDNTIYAALRQDIISSGLWDEQWYLSQYNSKYIPALLKRPSSEVYSPLDYYLTEGWRLGHQPSRFLQIDVDERAQGCSKLQFFLNRLRFYGYQFDSNPWVPSKKEIAQYNEFHKKRSSKKVVYTCITGKYNDLMQHCYIRDDWDYVCFTDDTGLAGKKIGIWDVRELNHSELDGRSANRWHKMHPHLLFPEYEESIYVDGNINIRTSYLFEEIIQHDQKILFPHHFCRDCAYDEIKVLLDGARIDEDEKKVILSWRDRIEREGFPKCYGLSENNILYRKHHNADVQKIMKEWWDLYGAPSTRDQVSFSYVLWRNDVCPRKCFISNTRTNFRDFWIVKHKTTASVSDENRVALKPAFSQDNVAVVFSTNEQYIPYLGVAIYSLIEHSSRNVNYDIIVLVNGISLSLLDKIKHLSRDYENISIRIHDVSQILMGIPKDLLHVEGYVPVETYNKCFLTEMLEGYKRCVYLDSDIIVLDDIQKLHDIDLEGRSIGASANIANINAAFCKKMIKGREFSDYLVNELGICDTTKYFQAGVVVLDMEKLSRMNLPKCVISFLQTVREPLFFDQCVFNSIFYQDTCYFSTSWNHVWYMQQYSYLHGSIPDQMFFDYASGRVSPKIIHFAGKDKPQTKMGLKLSDVFWEYAHESPFVDDIRQDILKKDNEISAIISDESVGPWYRIRPRVLVHLHLYYVEQLDFMLSALSNICSCEYDLIVTMVNKDENIESKIRSLHGNVQIVLLPNVGYDLFPFLHVLKMVRLSNYEYVLKLHTKNARQPGLDTVYGVQVPEYQWRDEIINAILGSKECFEANLALLQNDKRLGLIGAKKFVFSTHENDEEQNYSLPEWRSKCGIEGGGCYVGGSMFLARAYPFERLKALNMSVDAFRSSKMQTKDHKNLAHVFERLLGLVIEGEGFIVHGV